MRPILITGAAAILCVALTASANAITIAHPAIDSADVTQVARRDCLRDDRGWHYMRGEHRVSCRPSRPPGREWGWHIEGDRSGWWHLREHRWND